MDAKPGKTILAIVTLENHMIGDVGNFKLDLVNSFVVPSIEFSHAIDTMDNWRALGVSPTPNTAG